MFGTLRGALVARDVEFDIHRFTARVEGFIESVGQTIRINRIVVHYHLAVRSQHRKEAERALAVHPQGCPAHESVKDSINITWDAEIEEY